MSEMDALLLVLFGIANQLIGMLLMYGHLTDE